MTTSLAQADALVRLIDETGVATGLVEVAEAAVRCCHALLDDGEPARALELADRLLASDELNDRLAARLGLLRVRALFALARNTEMLDSAEALVIALRAQSLDSELVQARVYEGMALWRVNRVEESVARLSSLRTELLAGPESVGHAMCAAAISSAHLMAGKWEFAKLFALEALVSSTRVASDYWALVARENLSTAEKNLCHWAAAEEAIAEAAEGFERLKIPYQVVRARRAQAIILWKRGRLEKSSELLEFCRTEAEKLGIGGELQYARLASMLVSLHLGDFAAVESFSKSSVGEDQPTPTSRPSLLRHEYLGDLLLEQSKYAEALAQYQELWPKAMALVPRGDIVAELRRRIAECQLALGDARSAYAGAKEAVAHCLEISDRYEEACTYRTLALAAAALKRPDEAKKHFDHGFAMFDDIETPYEWGKLWVAYADWLCSELAGPHFDLASAHEAYRTAIDHFEHIGAQHKLAQARVRLEVLDARIAEEGAPFAPANRKVRPLRRPRWSAELQRRSQWALDTFGMVTRDRSLLEMLSEISTVAKSDLPVLILGESGTGKELVAKGVHELSGRTGQFVAINCSAIPATMLEDEFFGHVNGAFTSAAGDKAGLLEIADAGSVFMDEIGEMSLDLQAKLLRFLETNEFRRIGGTRSLRVDTRVVAATNRDREKMQNGDGFRSDLYYRLAHAVYTLPPLRQRGDDIELLVDHFLETFCEQHRKQVSLSSSARERLLLSPWPGNVRQLRAVMQKIVVSAPNDHVITPRELPPSEAGASPRGFTDEIDEQERRRITEALERTQFVKADAARLLRMSRTSMIAKMKRLGIPG